MKDNGHNLEPLYDAFGELIYVLAMADGVIQEEEITALEHILKTHPWSAEIQWSFNFERKKNNSIEVVYNKLIDICKFMGPHKEYECMIEVMTYVAKASEGIDAKEQKVIDDFRKDLLTKFRQDLENI